MSSLDNMPEDLDRILQEVNYWENPPQLNSQWRENYVNFLFRYCNSPILKVLAGQRRCGKSTILKQLINKLIKNKIPKTNILYLSFELHQLSFIQTHTMLTAVISHYYKTHQPKGTVFIVLDEIQEVEEWEKTVNSFLANERYQFNFFLTGSNAHLLSTELSTYVTGRFVEIPIFPFSYKEYCTYHDIENSKQTLLQFLNDSGLPELFSLSEKGQKISYLESLKNSILMHDIVKRFSIKNPKLLILLLDFLIDNTGKLFSINSISKKLKSIDVSTTLTTLANYLQYLEAAFLIRCAHRYNLKGKKILEGERKYYLNDLGFNSYLQSSFDNNITRRLENHVFLLLLQAGYQVYVGQIHHLEIDFVAEKDDKKIYIQVTYLLHSEEVISREYGNLECIKDNWPKWVVSLDDIKLPPKNGIEHHQIWTLETII